MQIVAYSGFSKRPNSTKQPTGGTSINVRLKEGTSALHPVFEIAAYNLSYNYFQWDGRFFFVRDIVILSDHAAEYHCDIDALATWKTAIGGSSQYVVRAASAYNGAIPDFKYPARAGAIVSTQNIDGFSAMVGSSGTYVVGVIGGNPASGSIAYYAMSASTFASLLGFMFAGSWLDNDETDISVITQKELVNPAQYIVSCNWFPFSITGGASSTIHFGWWDSGISASLLGAGDREYSLTATVNMGSHPEASARGNYLNCSPFTRRTAYVFTFGEIPINTQYFSVVTSIVFLLKVDLFTGAGKLSMWDGTGDNQVGVQYAQVGVPVQLAQLSQSIMRPVMSLIGGAVSTVQSRNVLGLVSGVGNALEEMMPQVAIAGSTGSAVDYFSAPKLVSEYMYQVPRDVAQHGRPLCDVMTISALNGFVQTEGADMDFPGSMEEKELVVAAMDGGFFYE